MSKKRKTLGAPVSSPALSTHAGEDTGAPRENTPRLRFPEFLDAGEWEIHHMGDMYCFLSTNSYSRDNLNYDEGQVKNIHYGDIHTKFATLFDVTQEIVPYINGTESLERVSAESYCNEGDIVFADASEDMEDVGKSIEIVNINNEKILSGMHTILARQRDDLLVIGFGGYLFKSALIREQIKRESQGAKVLGISSGRMSNIKICFPAKKNEQQKIADCLSSLDGLIAAQSEKLDALKTHKKGLMQRIFPRVGETVPRLRFPEFRDAGEWEEYKLGSLVEIFSGDAPRSHKLSSVHGCPYVKVEDMNNCSKYQRLSREYAAKSNSVLPVGAVLFPKRGAAIMGNKVRISAVPFYIDSNMMALFPRKESHLSSEYLYYLILDQQLSKIADISSIPQINNKHIVAYDVAIPSLPEQQKIADCLSSLDGLIAAQSEKLDALKTHKKGLMQQLFPAVEEVGV